MKLTSRRVLVVTASLSSVMLIVAFGWKAVERGLSARDSGQPDSIVIDSAVRRTADVSGKSLSLKGVSPVPIRLHVEYEIPTSSPNIRSLETADTNAMPPLMTQIELMPDSPVRDDLRTSVLRKWVHLDGEAAILWASQHPDLLGFIPDALREWASIGPVEAVRAWAFAKMSFASDHDASTWNSPDFVKSAFGGMAATPGDSVWAELNALSGTTQLHAMIGIADFASRRQSDTSFASNTEQHVQELGLPVLTAAFYAGAGHIEAAKEDLEQVSDNDQHRVIANEIAKQLAVFDPAQAIAWLESQYRVPSDAIADMTASIGSMHALNGGDVLRWLAKFPESSQRNRAMDEIQNRFPELRASSSQNIVITLPSN